MSVSTIRYLHHINEHIVCVVSIIVNVLLMRIVITEKNEMLKAYSKVLLQNCTVDLFCTIICFITELVKFFFYF